MKIIRKLFAGLLACALTCALPAPCAAASVSGFRDVPAGHWAAEAISRAVQSGIIQGESAVSFGLGHSMTRGAFAVVLCRFFGWTAVAPAAGSFTDNQNPGAWYYSAVETAYANGAVTRQSAAFRPGDPITREELTVMLVRALGCTAIAGLDQGLPCPFADVEANRGYLTMAYYLGIASGTGQAAFSPERPATREQAVVMLMRLYDRYHAPAPERIGVAAGLSALANLDGCAAVAVPAMRLTYAGGAHLTPSMPDADAQALKAAAQKGGAKAVLYLSAGTAVLGGTAADTAAAVAEAVSAGGWDGAMLDIPALPETQKAAYSQLAEALRSALGKKLFYAAAEAPAPGKAAAYDIPALCAQADRVLLRVPETRETVNGFPVAPLEPLERVYFALASLKGGQTAGKLSLWLTATGSAFSGSSYTGSVSAERIADLLAADSVSAHYSERYACAYLVRTVNGSRTVVWYQDSRAAAARARLSALLGVSSVCLSDLGSVAEYQGASVLAGLGG